MKKFFVVFVCLFSVLSFAGGKPTPLPESEVILSKIKSLDDAVTRMYVSHEFAPSSPEIAAKATYVDLIQLEAGAIEKLIASPSPVEEKEIVMIRYELGDARISNALIKAKNAGIRVRVVTDLNPALKGNFVGEEKYTFDFLNAQRAESPSAEQFDAMLAGGFKIDDPNMGISSQPLFPEGPGIKPIMHEKALLLREKVKGRVVKTTFHGTTNLVPNLRYNRTFEINDPDFYDYYYRHAEALIEAFSNKKQIKDVVSYAPRKIIYRDGSFQEQAFTDGKMNPNDRMIAFYTEAKEKPQLIKVDRDRHSQFVFTNKRVLSAMAELLEAQPAVTFFGIFDDRFIDLGGYGVSPALAGYDNYAQFGKGAYGLKEALVKRGQVFAYQRIAVDEDGTPRVETREDGPPVARHVWHDKTHVVTFKDLREPTQKNEVALRKKLSQKFEEERIQADTGSLNCSNHYENAELQVVMNAGASSPLMRGLIESIEHVVALEPEYAVFMDPAVLRNSVGLITGHTDLEIPLDVAIKLHEKLIHRDYDGFIKSLLAVAVSPSTLDPRPSIQTVVHRIHKFGRFLEWYKKTVDVNPEYYPLKARKVLALTLILGNDNLSPYKAKLIVKEAIWKHGLTEEKEKELIQQGLDLLEVTFKERPAPVAIVEPQKVLPVEEVTPEFSWNFDWDDNVMVMPTQIYVFEKNTRKEVAVSTGKFAKIRSQIGVAGTDWENFYVDSDPHFGSFRRFREAPGDANFFLEDIVFNIENVKEEVWMGPSFWALVQALSTPEGAKRTTIITARGQPREEILDGLKHLQSWLKKEKNIIIYLPPLENIYAVGESADPSKEKLRVMQDILDHREKEAVALNTTMSWGFSDDDYGNFSTAIQGLGPEIAKQRWPHVKSVLYYTGPVVEHYPIKVVVLRSNGDIRQIFVDGADTTGVSQTLKEAKTCNDLLQALPQAA
ncbi:MAG: hypothetical protein AB7F43_04825 [Bacteriovoracia bacterium]